MSDALIIPPTASCDIALGDMRATVLSDGHLDVPSDYFTEPDGSQTTRLGSNVWVLRGGGRVWLVDGGSGEALRARFAETGRLVSRLAEIGVRPGDVTDVVLSHMHADHIGGLSARGAPVFPRAVLHASVAEWRFWTDPALLSGAPDAQKPMIQMIQALAAPLQDRLRLHSGAADLGAGVALEPAPGHTPGHLAVRVSGGGAQLLLAADVALADIQLRRPEVGYALEVDPATAAATRRRVLDMAAADGLLFAATHLPFPGVAMIERHGEGFAASALS